MGTNSFTNYKFESRIDISIHEIIHALGFSSFAIKYWIDPTTGNHYTAANTSKITKNVKIRGI